jgi:hypothetical protein
MAGDTRDSHTPTVTMLQLMGTNDYLNPVVPYGPNLAGVSGIMARGPHSSSPRQVAPPSQH